MKKINTVIVILGLLLIGCGTYYYRHDILNFCMKYIIHTNRVVTLESNQKNDYFIDYDFQFLKNTDNFSPKNRQDIINIYYTVLNYGLTDFSFYCNEDYQNCIRDVKDISNNQALLSNINNFVHAYNSFKNIETEYDNFGKVTIRIEHAYTKEKQDAINKKVKEIWNELNLSDKTKSNEDKIKLVHDYIINHSKYDKARSDDKVTEYDSDIAYGNLLQGYGICGGYTDSMKLFLDDMKIPNYKIASENHVWNLVKLDNKWYHLDLTWDDPVVLNGKDILEYNFFLITYDELKALKTNQHYFDTSIYQEAL